MVRSATNPEAGVDEKVASSALLNGETLFSLAASAATIPGHRGNPHARASTLVRWITRGVRTASGEVVKLEAVRIGTAWRTSREALARFSERLTEAAAGNREPAPVSESPRRRNKKSAAASAELDRILNGSKPR